MILKTEQEKARHCFLQKDKQNTLMKALNKGKSNFEQKVILVQNKRLRQREIQEKWVAQLLL
ncbi:MAG: hypothetical protein KAW02_01555 [candidate division Zixibacteria bacterium]|nr:hypothetical protein [candidate division Zixibacteria bacterium]